MTTQGWLIVIEVGLFAVILVIGIWRLIAGTAKRQNSDVIIAEDMTRAEMIRQRYVDLVESVAKDKVADSTPAPLVRAPSVDAQVFPKLAEIGKTGKRRDTP